MSFTYFASDYYKIRLKCQTYYKDNVNFNISIDMLKQGVSAIALVGNVNCQALASLIPFFFSFCS